jgi:hypothetical protein
LLWPAESRTLSLVNWDIAKERLIRDYGINVENFISWPKVNELRLVANTVKHADGASCNNLKSLRPDLFDSPRLEGDASTFDLVKMREVFQPLIGEDLYVNRDEFANYVSTVKQFWEELANAFDDAG